MLDSKAIRIERNGQKLGYVDRGRLELLHRFYRLGHSISGEIVRKNGTPERPLIYIYSRFIPKAH